VEKGKKDLVLFGPYQGPPPKTYKKTAKREEKSALKPPPTFPKLMSKI
jgi:hypothetical protein